MIGLPSPAPTLLLSSPVASTSTHSSWYPPPPPALPHYLPNITTASDAAIHLITSRSTLKLVKSVRMTFKDAIALHWTGVCLIKSCKRMQVLDLSVHIICVWNIYKKHSHWLAYVLAKMPFSLQLLNVTQRLSTTDRRSGQEWGTEFDFNAISCVFLCIVYFFLQLSV